MTKLLIAEDDQNIRLALRRIIPWQDNEITLCTDATNGRQVLEIVQKEHPDILLLDIQMPFLDGIQVAKILSEQHFEGEIIILSGHDEFAYAQAAIKYGVFEYLLKPCRPNDILECVLKCRDRIASSEKQKLLWRGMEQKYYLETEQQFKSRILSEEKEDLFAPPDHTKRDLLEFIRTGEAEQAEYCIQTLFRYLSGALYTKQAILNYLFTLFLPVVDLRAEHELLSDEILRCRDFRYLAQFQRLKEVQDLLQKLSRETAELCRSQFGGSLVIREALLYIKAHYNEDIELKKISDAIHITPAYLSVLFKKHVGMNYLDYLNRYRIDRASEDLAHSKKKIYQIARENGFKDEKYFSNVFKKIAGLSPSEYRTRYYKQNPADFPRSEPED